MVLVVKRHSACPNGTVYVEIILPSCPVCALVGRLKMKKKNIAKSREIQFSGFRVYCLQGCLDTLNIPADRLALQQCSKTHEKPYNFIVCEFGSFFKSFRVCASPYASAPSLHRESTDSLITGSESQHMAVRLAILNHMVNIAHFILDRHILGYTSIQQYITAKKMDQGSAWGTDVEMLTLAHLLNTSILSYSVQHGSWQRYAPHHVDRSLVDDFQQMSMYIVHDYNHFNVVCSIRKTA